MKLAKKTLLAIAAGTSIDQLGLDKPEANALGTVLAGADAAELQTDATELRAAVEARVAAAVQPVQTQLEAASANLLAANGELQTLRAGSAGLVAQREAAQKLADAAQAVVRNACAVMAVALGGADTAKELSGEALLAEHARLEPEFQKKFPAGGVSGTSATGKEGTVKPDAQLARFAALANSAPK